MLLHGQRREILLSALQGLGFCACSPLPIHPEPQDRNDKPRYASGYILSNLPALLFTKLLDALIVGFYLSDYRRAVEHLILRLNYSDGLWCPARTRRYTGGKASCRDPLREVMHAPALRPRASSLRHYIKSREM